MMGGSTSLSNRIGAAPPADAETGRLRNYVKSLAASGMHILFIEPGGKAPVDMRSPQLKRAEDTAAQAIARENGRPDWSKVKSKRGVHLATNDPVLLGRYLDRYRKTFGETTAVNMAIAVGPSRLVVVDCDTAEQVAAFLADFGVPLDTPIAPTVRSPGQRDADGTMVHYGGGHYYFTLPEDVELPAGSGSLTMPGGYALLWDGRYVLIPPSVRAEGTYYLAGEDFPATPPILSMIREHAARRTDRRQEFGAELGELSENIDRWSQLVSWEDLLEPAGWTLAARPDGCGCQVWTAPGLHASPKSATAHDTGCTYDRYSDVNAPLHVWTDNPGDELAAWIDEHGGTKTITKLQVAAILHYGGDVGTACSELGVIPKDDLSLDTDEVVRDLGLSTSNLDEPMSMDPPTTTDGTPFVPDNPNVRPPYDNGGIAGGMVSKTNDTGKPIEMDPTFESLKNAAVDEALARAKEQAQADLEYDAAHVELGSGRVQDWSEERINAAKEFTESQRESTYTYGTHEADGLTLMAAVEDVIKQQDPHSNVSHESSGLAVGFSAPASPPMWGALPDGSVVSGHTVPEQEQASGPDTLPGVDPPSDPPNDPPQFAEPEEFADGVLEQGNQFMPRIAWFDYWRDYPAPEFLVEGLIENGGLTAIIGPSGVGKTLVLLDIIACITTGQRWHGRAVMQQRGIYLPGEGMSGFIQRLGAWEKAHKSNTGRDLAIGEGILRAGAPKAEWERLVQVILQNRIGFLVFDTVARMAVGVEENSAAEMGKVVARLDEVRKLTGVTVLLVHHTKKDSDSARGSSALNGALDTEILITEGWVNPDGSTGDTNEVSGKPLNAKVTKQKNADSGSVDNLLMVPFGDSVIITGPSGEIGDVFDEMTVARALMPEPAMETAARLAAELDHFTQQGLTVTEACQAVSMDEYTARRGDAAKAWRLAMRRAVDLGLRYELIQTLTGKDTGSRYIRTGLAVAQFREKVIKDGLSE
jgi:energy-coupling factor transporter ATP-binding protein EcfA2